jgi:hypothetical protein
MKRNFTIFSLSFISLVVLSVLMVNSFGKQDEAEFTSATIQGLHERAERKAARVEGYREWLNSMKANPRTGEVEMEDVFAAREQMKAYYQKVSENERGGSVLNLQWESMGPTNVGGRTRIILIDKTNPNRMYAGGASGGLYYTNNGGLEWFPHPQNAEFSSLLICGMDQAANGDIYFGTGEYWADYYDGSFGSYTHGFVGDGMFKASAVAGDALPTFTQLTATIPTPGEIGSVDNVSWAYVNRVTCNPLDANMVVAATNTGLKISKDGGTTWDNCEGGGTALSGVADDALFDAEGYLHSIASSQRKYYRSNNTANPEVMDELGIGLPVGSIRRVLAVAPSDNNYVYVYSAKSGTYGLQGVYQSTDFGANFTQITEEANDFFNPNGTGANVTWNVCIAVKPDDPQRIYIGGQIQSWTWNGASGAWTPMTSSGYPTWYAKYLHADQHFITFHPENPDIMYFGSDGGVSRTLNANSQYPDFGTLNKGLNFYQSHGIAVGIQGEPMGGSQDNGTQYVNFDLNSELQSVEVLGGDGGKTEISRVRPEYLFGTFFSVTANGNGAVLRRSVNEGSTMASIYDCNIDGGVSNCSQDGLADGGTDFVTPFVLWENYNLFNTFKDILTGGSVEYPAGSGDFYALGDDVEYEGRTITLTNTALYESRLYHAVKGNVWVTTGALFNSTEAPEWFKVLPSTSGAVSAIEYDESGDVIYVGTESGKLYRVSGLLNAAYEYVDVDDNPVTPGVFSPATAGITSFLYANTFPGKITGISIDRNNADEIAISIGGFGVDQNVWYSDNALDGDAAIFQCLSDGGALPNIPAYDILMHVTDNDKLLIATEFGVWSYSISAGGDWTQENTAAVGDVAPGNVPVFEIREEWIRDTDCYAIYIGTHGNGYYRATNLGGAECDFTTVSSGPIQEEIIAGITLAPNPADIYTNANLILNEAGLMSISIVNLTGVTVKDLGTANYVAGVHNINIDVRDLTPGIYLVVFTIDGQLTSKRLVVI